MYSRHIWYMDLFIKSVILKHNVQTLCFIYTNNWYCNSLLFHYLLATISAFYLDISGWDLCCDTFVPLVTKRWTSMASSTRSVFSIATTIESYANSSRCLARLPARNRPILLGQTVGSCWEETHLSDRVQCGRWHKQPCGWFLLAVGSASNATVPGGGLRLLICGDRGFESGWGQGSSSLVSVVCCVRSGLCESWSLA